MGRHRKKSKTKNHSETPDHDQIGPIPTDIIIEILERLPVKSLGRFTSVSKSWETIIRSKEFVRSFTSRSFSSHPPRLLLTFRKSDYRSKIHDWTFCSTDLTYRTKFKIVNKKYCDVKLSYVHGLMSFVYGQCCHVIISPSSGKTVTLPSVVSRRQVVKRFFGYAPVGDEHKVLCIVKGNYGSGTRIAPNEDQVLTLGTSKWRYMKCTKVPHSPICNGLCIDGVVYYFAYVRDKLLSLVKFDVRYEELSFFPSGLFNLFPNLSIDLIRFEGNVAVANRTTWNTFDLWVLKDAVNDEWVKICLSVFTWSNMVNYQPFRLLGTAHTGELILTHLDSYGGLNVTFHDHKTKNQRKFEVLTNNTFDLNLYGTPNCYLDYRDSVMFM